MGLLRPWDLFQIRSIGCDTATFATSRTSAARTLKCCVDVSYTGCIGPVGMSSPTRLQIDSHSSLDLVFETSDSKKSFGDDRNKEAKNRSLICIRAGR